MNNSFPLFLEQVRCQPGRASAVEPPAGEAGAGETPDHRCRAPDQVPDHFRLEILDHDDDRTLIEPVIPLRDPAAARRAEVSAATVEDASIRREAGLAATKLLVTVEEIVDEIPPAMNSIVLPHFTVTAVSHVPGGAWPSYAHGRYARDNHFYLRWDAIARDRNTFTAWIDRHVRGTADHRAFLASLREAA